MTKIITSLNQAFFWRKRFGRLLAFFWSSDWKSRRPWTVLGTNKGYFARYVIEQKGVRTCFIAVGPLMIGYAKKSKGPQ